MGERWEWTTNAEAAVRIFEFLGVTPVQKDRNQGDLLCFEGALGGCILSIVCSAEDPKCLGLEQRDELYRTTGGAILVGCTGIEYDEEEHQAKRVVVRASGGYVEIMEGGLFSTIGSQT